MRVLLAAPRGFCAGVDVAVATLDRVLERSGPPVYAFHQIVHNAYLVARYEAAGVVFVDDVGDVPEGATVVFSAHGVSPAVRRAAAERRLRVVDATCPLVQKVHAEARRFARDGYTVILVGHRGHDETVGVLGEAPERMRLVETVHDVAALDVPDPARVAYLTQTTLSVDDARAIVAALRRRFPHVVGPAKDDICYATQNRQEAVRALAAEGELVLVVGSRNSSNSRRLAEVAERQGARAHLVDGADDLDPAWLAGVRTVVVTAGASVPEVLVGAVVARVREWSGATVEERRLLEEDVRFQLPPSVRGVVA